MGKNIEAEGGELTLRNQNRDIIIVPKHDREKILKMLKNKDHEGIDEYASSLPYMEDYADDGSLLLNDNIGPEPGPGEKGTTKNKTITSKKSEGLYTNKEYEALKNDYYTNSKYTKYSAKTPGAGCVGSSCKNFDVLYPDKKGFYEDYSSVGLFQKEYPKVVTSNKGVRKPQGSSVGIDAWEAEDFITHNKLGEPIVSANDKDYLKKLYGLDPRDIPIGSMLTFGDAVKAGYVEKGAPNWRGVKDQHMTQHGGVAMGYVEDEDEEGNQVYNLMVDELGLKTIGQGKTATMSWPSYVSSRDMRGIVKRYSSPTNYWDLSGKEKKKIFTRPKTVDVLKDIERYKKEMLESIKWNEENEMPGYPKGSYAKAQKEGIKIPKELLYKFGQSTGLAPGNPKIVEVEKKK